MVKCVLENEKQEILGMYPLPEDGNLHLTPDDIYNAVSQIEAILNKNNFPALVVGMNFYDRFEGVEILSDRPMPGAWGFAFHLEVPPLVLGVF